MKVPSNNFFIGAGIILAALLAYGYFVEHPSNPCAEGKNGVYTDAHPGMTARFDQSCPSGMRWGKN